MSLQIPAFTCSEVLRMQDLATLLVRVCDRELGSCFISVPCLSSPGIDPFSAGVEGPEVQG